MAKYNAGPEIETLIKALSKLPGLGPRSARRAALHLVKKREQVLMPLHRALGEVAEKVTVCRTCGNVDTRNPCMVCSDPSRDHSTIVVVEDVSDLWALERARVMDGVYHVLGGVLSPLDGIGPEDLSIGKLVDRITAGDVKEVVIAVNATVEGQTTIHYISDQIKDVDVKVTRLAHGVPVGGELDYMDEGTLAAAMRTRTAL
jgi:recombination protein RecR